MELLAYYREWPGYPGLYYARVYQTEYIEGKSLLEIWRSTPRFYIGGKGCKWEMLQTIINDLSKDGHIIKGMIEYNVAQQSDDELKEIQQDRQPQIPSETKEEVRRTDVNQTKRKTRRKK